MDKYILSCCSTADLAEEYYKKRNIYCIQYNYELDGKQYKDDFGKSILLEKFYELLSHGSEVKTSQINVGEFQSHFEPLLEKGFDILHVCFSSGLSGTINSANIAKNILLEKYPNRKIYIVDSLGGSCGYGLIMDKLADLRDSGMNLNDLYDWANQNCLKMHHWFFSTDLSFFIRGGRLSPLVGKISSLLNIFPLLNADRFGKLALRFKIRGKQKIIQEIVNKMEQYADDGLNYKEKCYIAHSACCKYAKDVSDLIEKRFSNLIGKVKISYIGHTMGCHSGPGTVALFFWGSKRID